MCDMEKKLKYMKRMKKGIVPEEYQHDGGSKKYKTEHEKYKGVISVLDTCDSRERENLEVILTCEIETIRNLYNFRNIVPIFLSVSSMIISFGISFINLIVTEQSKMNNPQTMLPVISSSMNSFIWVVFSNGVIGVLIYLGLSLYCSKKLNISMYLLEILKRYDNSISLIEKEMI